MTEPNVGKIRKRENPFSQVANHPLRNPNLSLKAKGLYAVIQSFINIPDFVLYKTTLMNTCSEGKDAFESAWKELKKAGYLVQYRVMSGGRFSYEYELLDIPDPNYINSPHPEKPVPENPDTVKPSTENQGYIEKNEVSNNDLKNKELIITHSSERALLLLNANKVYEDKFDNDIDGPFKYRLYLCEITQNAEIEGMKKHVIQLFFDGINKTPYTYNDFLVFAACQVNIGTNYWSSSLNIMTDPRITYAASLEWVKAMANVYSTENETIRVGKNTVNTINFKQRLLQINPETFENILRKFAEVKDTTEIKNTTAYMLQMLYNGAFDSGYNSF